MEVQVLSSVPCNYQESLKIPSIQEVRSVVRARCASFRITTGFIYIDNLASYEEEEEADPEEKELFDSLFILEDEESDEDDFLPVF